MESNFNNREFEHYVKSNADQYRMIPSEKVWKSINNVLHTRRKWYSVGLGLLLLLTAVSVTWVMVSYPVSKTKEPVSAVKSPANVTTQPVNPGSRTTTGSPLESISNLLSFNKVSKQDNANLFPGESTAGSENNLVPFTENEVSDQVITISPGNVSKINTDKGETVFNSTNTTDNRIVSQDVTSSPDAKIPTANNSPAISDKAPARHPENYYPLSIESVVNAYHAKKINKKLIWQVYFTPTISYRKLSENKSFEESPVFNAPNYAFASSSDINRAVTHKADMGVELGVSAKYPLSKNLKLTGGLQFNINRYDIKAAYTYYGEQATISLNGGNGDDLITWTNYRNYNGSKSDWLKNFYFSVSAPVGAELKLFGNDKTNFGIAGTVQPTYIIGDKAYLISTDYKNYAKVPGLIRHVNVNTSFETFVSYSSRNGARWQIGPQVRYQVLSSFKNKYQVIENLFDYGIKIGITLNP